jgi:fructokinase
MRIGIDIGGTKIEAVVLDRGGAELMRRRLPTPHEDYQAAVEAITGLVNGIETELGPRAPAIGIGIPGSMSPATGLARIPNAAALHGHPLDRDLESALRRPVRLENDANCFALAEAMAGAGQGAEVVFGVILGTGVGGGTVVAGRVIAGHNLVAGEWGHNRLAAVDANELDAPRCNCGRVGCIEAWCSGPSMARDHARVTGETLQPAEIAARAGEGDVGARATLDRHADRLARALSGVVNLLDPDVIVLGGGLSNLGHLCDELPERMRPHVHSDVFETPIRKNRLGDSAGVIGAAWLWPEEAP